MKCIFFSFILFFSFAALAQEKPEGLFINSKAPEFRLKDQNGEEVRLRDLRSKGPVVIIFYRGFWCPYCNRELKRFQDSLAIIRETGATVVAITPEAAEGIAKTVEKTGAAFPILHDEQMKLAKGYAVAYEVDEKTAQRYKSFGNDLLVINNQKEKPFLPVPAVYIVNKDGSVTYRFFNTDYRRRPWVADLLKEIRKIR